VYGAGAVGLIGRRAVVRTPLRPRGQVFLRGELWEAELEDEDAGVDTGGEVVIDKVEGLTLHVSPAPPLPPPEGAAT
jgi:membrane-bound serine protease (ClpP class)